MPDYYNDVYLKRLNRYGLDYQSRIQGQREKVFEDLFLKSVYRVDFPYQNEIIPGLLERYKQDDTETLQYLLVRVDQEFPIGTILQIPNKNYQYGEALTDDNSYYWLIYYLENIKASGYNRYVVLKMTHVITWNDRSNTARTTRGYFYSGQRGVLKDSIIGDRKGPLYEEPTKESHIIMPLNQFMKKEDYFELTDTATGIVEAYRVTGYDIQSTPGVEFVTVDPVYERDKTPAPTKTTADTDEEFYWLDGGVNG